jgi:formylmethanofuran dehydrogenase subunit C
MSALTFTLKKTLTQKLDVTALTPDLLAEKSPDEIAATELPYGKKNLRTDEVFEISGSDTSQIIFEKSHAKIDYIGAGLKTGRITVNGDAGAFLGFQMKQGEIVLNGNAADFAACAMAGGLLKINGNVGDFLGAALIGDKKGMKGGTVLVSGNAGERTGDQMRRGIILIEGNVGKYCASRMLAGTIGVLGDVGEYVGYGMRRGTLLLSKTPKLHATIQDCGTHTLPYLSLMFKSFSDLPSKFSQLNQNRVQRYAGDLATDGKGEILVFNQ